MSVGIVDKQTGDRIPTAGMSAIDDALSATSTNPVQNAVITAALADKQDKTDNALQTTDKTVVGAINEHEGDISSLKSGLINVADDVKLNTQDLTTPSRSINLMSLPITITKSLGSTGTVTNNNGVITLNGEFLKNEVITITCADCIVPNDAIIAYMNNFALSSANISFHNGSIKHDYFSFSIPNRIIYTSALASVVGKTINRYDINFTANITLDNFTFSLMMVHSGQDVSSYVPNIPSVDARLDAVESGLTNLSTAQVVGADGEISDRLSTATAIDNFFKSLYNKKGFYHFSYYDANKESTFATAINSANGFCFVLNNESWLNHPLAFVFEGGMDAFIVMFAITNNSYSVSLVTKLARSS